MDAVEFSERVQVLRERAVRDLKEAHEYYADTVFAWAIVGKYVALNQVFSLNNFVTGSTTSQDQLIQKSSGYISNELAEATFQQFLAIFEYWLFDLLRVLLAAYPRHLEKKKVEFKDVLDSPDKDAIARLVIDKELNELQYKKPSEWFDYLEGIFKKISPAVADIEQFTEAKAARDVLVHNQGVVSPIYVQKTGARARFKLGEIVDITEPYHREVWELLLGMVAEISDGIAAP